MIEAFLASPPPLHRICCAEAALGAARLSLRTWSKYGGQSRFSCALTEMNTYNRAQGMNNRLNMLFNQELDNEAQYIKSHPFSSINMSLVGALSKHSNSSFFIFDLIEFYLREAKLNTSHPYGHGTLLGFR